MGLWSITWHIYSCTNCNIQVYDCTELTIWPRQVCVLCGECIVQLLLKCCSDSCNGLSMQCSCGSSFDRPDLSVEAMIARTIMLQPAVTRQFLQTPHTFTSSMNLPLHTPSLADVRYLLPCCGRLLFSFSFDYSCVFRVFE